MGAWSFLRVRWGERVAGRPFSRVSRPASATPATGIGEQPQDRAGGASAAPSMQAAARSRGPSRGDDMSVDVTVPSVGESISEVFIGTWLKGEGDAVAKDEAIVEIETDKATLEVSAPVDGVLAGIRKQAGDSAERRRGDRQRRARRGRRRCARGRRRRRRGAGRRRANDAEAAKAASAPIERRRRRSEVPREGAADADGDVKVMPAAQRLLDEHGLRAADVAATGPGGRLAEGRRAAAPRGLQGSEGPARRGLAGRRGPPRPSPRAGRTEEAVPMSTLRRRIAERLVEAQQTAALLTTFNEIDMSAVMALRAEYKESFEKRHGVRLGFMSFFVKATIDALKSFPQINAEIRGTDMVYKDYYDIGVAVSTKRGLVVPVLRDAERISFAEVEKAIGDFGQRAQAGKLTPDELQGGTFTITNGGVFGSLLSTPIVNPPQSGVLGMHAIQERPIRSPADDVRATTASSVEAVTFLKIRWRTPPDDVRGADRVRPPTIVDGRDEAVTFLKRIKEAPTCENPARMLMEV
jgi:2-oxoglutarate dehydrogenase E2 component (dihydrolipoamide succinyltransferase)